MPLSLLNFETFWEDPDKPALLASFIAPLVSDFNTKYVNADGSIKRPGRPIAHAGLDRLVPPNTPITLNGGSSLFASQFRWEVVTRPNNSSPTLAQATSLTPVFTTDTVGTYELSLTVSNDGGMSHTDMVTLKVDAGATDPSLIRFADVKRILQGDCVACHTAARRSSRNSRLVYGYAISILLSQPVSTGKSQGKFGRCATQPVVDQAFGPASLRRATFGIRYLKSRRESSSGELRPVCELDLRWRTRVGWAVVIPATTHCRSAWHTLCFLSVSCIATRGERGGYRRVGPTSQASPFPSWMSPREWTIVRWGVYCLCFTPWVGARGYTALHARAVVECGLCYQTCHMSGAQGADLADQTSVGGGDAAPPRWRGRVAVHVCGPRLSLGQES